ncbi:MAG: DUF3048 domain-containing protein [Actinobacteria bacterium]|nr:DUF3048 domain-containing protein [Actinomycetota bacterium]
MTTPDERTSAGDDARSLTTLVSRRQLFALAGGAALLSACSGGSGQAEAPTTSAAPTTTRPPASTTTTAAPTTTTMAPTTTEAPTTPAPPPPVQPLTGLPLTDPALLAKVALIVKISNDKGARPQTGLNNADIVFEAWGAGPTRFATVWHSRDEDFVGPIRSCREQDINLCGEFNGAVFACSGGNPGNIALLRASDMLLVTEGKGPGWELDPKRKRPHKTHADTAQLRSNAGPERTGPAQQFRYRGVGEPATAGEAMVGFDLQMQQVFVQWRYDPATGTYLRLQDDKPHMLADGTQVSTENVVIMWTDYGQSTTDGRSPAGASTGSNPAQVFTGGRAISGTWSRADRLQPFAFTADDGSPILLTPGRTFIELASSGKGSFPGSDEFTPAYS